MKILQQGVLPTYSKKFSCTKCGCIFEADKTEYCESSQMEVIHDGLPNYKCKCPTCGNTVYADQQARGRMTIAERNNKLKHFITCLKCGVSGKYCDDNCPTQYDAGNMSEIIENLEAISKALEPCEDAISRAELLKAMDTYDKYGYTETGCFVRSPKNDYVSYVHYDDMVNCVKGMPSVTPQEPRWIPCSERYPQIEDEYKYFLVTDDKGKVSVQEFFISLDEEPQPYFSGMVNVIAWMPLPKPYKAESEDEE